MSADFDNSSEWDLAPTPFRLIAGLSKRVAQDWAFAILVPAGD